MSRVRDFLEGEGRDGAGRTIADILAFRPEGLERHHDYIQWLFPLPDPSLAVPGSPVLDPADIIAIRASALARANLERGAALMTAFYEETAAWLRPADHNHLRITRIIRSLRLLIGDEAADRFRDAILRRADGTAAPINPVSRAYWLAA